MTGSAPADDRGESPVGGLLLPPHPLDRCGICARSTLVRPAKSETGPAFGRLKIRRRRDRADVRDGQPPRRRGRRAANRRSPRVSPGVRSRTGRGPDAAAPAGRRLLDDDRALPTRSEGGRRQVRPDHRRVGGERRLDVEDEIARRRCRAGARSLSACQRASRSNVNVSTRPRCSIVLLRRLASPRASGVEAERLDGRRREQREAAVAACRGAGALEQAVDEDDVGPGELVPAGDATPDVRAVVDEHLEVEPAVPAGTSCSRSSSPGRCSAVDAGRRGRTASIASSSRTRRRARPRRTGRPRHPRTWPVGTAARAGRRSSRGGRRRWPARARSRSPRGTRCSRSGRR